MTAMIGRRKSRLRGVFSLEHPGRMRYANKEHCILVRVCGGIVNGASVMLLQHIVDVLHALDIALTNTIRSLEQPTNGRSKCNAVVPNLSVDLQFLEHRPMLVIIDLFHA